MLLTRVKKKILRWAMGILGVLIILVVAGVLLLDPIAKAVAEKRMRAETGMETKIGKFTVGLRSSIIHIENLVLKNPAEFGGDTFVKMPEIFLDYDREALRAGKLHLNVVRIDLAEIHVVENKEGKRNVDELQKNQRKPKPDSPGSSTNQNESPFVFEGIDTLNVTLRTARFTSFKNPKQNLEQDLGIRHETFKNLKTEKDFQTAAGLLTLKIGASLLWSGEFTNPLTLFLGGSTAGKETKNILEGLTEPLPIPTHPTPAP